MRCLSVGHRLYSVLQMAALCIGLTAPCASAASPLASAPEQGVFESGDARASLSSDGKKWTLQFELQPSGLAGLWAKNGNTDALPDHPQELRYIIQLDPGVELPVPLHWEVKGWGGVQHFPVVIREPVISGRGILDSARLGNWREVVMVVSHPGGDATLAGRVHVSAELVKWSETQILIASTGFRWILLAAATLLASFLAVVTSLAPWSRRPQSGLVRVFTNSTAFLVAAGCLAAILGTAATPAGRFPFTQALVVLAGAWLSSHLTRVRLGRGATALETLGHAFLPGMLVVAAGDLAIWTATGQWADLVRITRPAAAAFWLLYHAAHLASLSSAHRPLSPMAGLRLVCIPFLFGVLLLLPNRELMSEAGLLLWSRAAPEHALLTGRMLTLLGFNFLALFACACVPSSWKGGLRALLVLPLTAAAVAASPTLADLGSGALAAGLLWHPYLALGGAMLSQGMLWAGVYLVTGMLMAGLRRRRFEDLDFIGLPRRGFHNGMMFGGCFMGLLLAGHALFEHPLVTSVSTSEPMAFWALLGGFLFPLAKTIMETFDGSPSFFRRLARNIRHPVLLLRGALAGGLIAWACLRGITGWELEDRAFAGFIAGAFVYGGVTFATDLLRVIARRGVIAGWRLYLVELHLGGLAGAAIAFYFDASQTPVVLDNLRAYTAYGADPRLSDVYPLLSRWGYFELGHHTGGARLLWNQALTGVITWGVAAWLFAVNRSFLLAFFQREWHPVRRLFSRDGLSELADGTIVVLRWGLWMAPIIATFLRRMPEATWYNQDGAIRTLVCIYQNSALAPADFQAWSLKLFLWVLAFDAFRVLIWLDHMGLRVATLVNLSFIGMERLDLRVARFIGPDAGARFLPEGVKRFATWTPLLIPFYMPVGAAWDQVWEQSCTLHATEIPWIELVWSLPLFHGMMGVLSLLVSIMACASVVRWWRLRRPVHVRNPVRLENRVYALSYSPDGSLVSEYLPAGIDLHRRAYSRRDPCGRALFLAEPDPGGGSEWISWPVFGNHPAEIAVQPSLSVRDDGLHLRHRSREIEVDLRIALAGKGSPVEEWKITLRNTSRRARKLCLSPYVEWTLNNAGADRSHTQYNRLFPEISYDPALTAVLANHRGTKMCGFLAADRAPDGLHLARVDFIGRAGTLWSPRALRHMDWRPVVASRPCPMFDSIAALCFQVELPAGCELPLRLWIGCAAGREAAAEWITSLCPPPPPESLSAPVTPIAPVIGHGCAPGGEYTAFTDEGRVLRVLTPFTPRPFDHTMSNSIGQVTAVTNRGLHASSNGNAQQNRLTPDWPDTTSRELPGEAIYLHDPADGQWYSPCYEPLRQPDARHEVEFRSDGTALFRMTRHAISTELTVFVPPDEPLTVYHLRVRNELLQPRRLTIAPYFEMVLADMPERSGALRVTESADSRGLLFENPRNTFRSGPAFVAVTPAPSDTLTCRGDFFSPARSNARPAWVEHGLVPKAGSHGDHQSVAAFRMEVEVPASGETEVVIVLGQAGTQAEAERLITLYAQPGHASSQHDATRRWWNDFMARIEVRTADSAFDGYLAWLRYQALAGRIWARKGFYQASGAFGFRDQLQDSVNLIWADPSLARRQILLHAAQQFIEGDTVHWFFLQQDGRTGFASRSHASDNLLWLGWAVGEYVGMTGDHAILDERVAYLDAESPLPPLPEGKHGMGFFPLRSQCAETLAHHVLRAVDLVLDHRMGRHGLPLIGTGDWNDGLDEIGSHGRGESIWMGFFLHVVLKRMLPLLEPRLPARRLAHYRRRLELLAAAIETTWRDDRYLRAIHDDGTEIGVKGGGIWEVDALTASWAVFAGINMERARIVFDTAIAALEREHVILLGAPPLNEKSKPYLGRSSKYPEGVRENGMYSHGVQWLVGAARLLAMDREAVGEAAAAVTYRDAALRLWRKISALPHTTADRIDVYGGQPNQQAADFLTTHDTGRMIWNGYTGAAAWMFRQALEGVLGARLENGVLIPPAENGVAGPALPVLMLARPSPAAAPSHVS